MNETTLDTKEQLAAFRTHLIDQGYEWEYHEAEDGYRESVSFFKVSQDHEYWVDTAWEKGQAVITTMIDSGYYEAEPLDRDVLFQALYKITHPGS